MTTSPVLIAGAGIGGLSVALTLHQIGVPCIVFESVADIKPLGLGINIQPNAIRELYELGFGPESLDTIGLQTKEWALVGLNGNEVYSESRAICLRSGSPSTHIRALAAESDGSLSSRRGPRSWR